MMKMIKMKKKVEQHGETDREYRQGDGLLRKNKNYDILILTNS